MIFKRPVAVFDLDGTLFRWSLSIATIDKARRRGLFPGVDFSELDRIRKEWKARKCSYTLFAAKYVEMLDQGMLAGIRVSDFEDCARHVVEQYGERVYVFTRALHAAVRDRGYYTVALSGSPIEVVRHFASLWGFDEVLGTVEDIGADGRFTGDRSKADLPVFRKDQEFRRIAEQQAGFEGSIAIGDTYGDAPMIALAQYPIAFNGDGKLAQAVRGTHCGRVTERKDTVTCWRRGLMVNPQQLLPFEIGLSVDEALIRSGITVDLPE